MAEQPKVDNQPTSSENSTPDPTNQTSDQGPWYNNMTRRQFLLRAGATLVGTAGTLVAAKKVADFLAPPPPEQSNPNIEPINPENLQSPEILKSGPEFGGNTHVHPFPKEGDNMTLEEARNDVDRLVEAKQEWLRFNLINPGTITQNTDGSLEFSEGIEVFDQLIDYAKQKGLKIALVTNSPESLASLPTEEYVTKTAGYYKELAKRYKGKVDSWQLFNEADTHHFRDYRDISQGFDNTYLEELSKIVEAAVSAIKSEDKDAQITMNASLWAPDRNVIRDRTSRFFDALAQHLDFISLDPYPDVYDPNSGATIPQDIEYFSKRYNKDIAIAEFGVSKHDVPDAQKRADILNAWISAIKSGNVQPKYALIYEMRDEKANQDPREAKFGNEDTWDKITLQMQTSQNTQTNQTPV